MIYTVGYEVDGFKSATIQDVKNFIHIKKILPFDLETTGFFPQNSSIISVVIGDINDQFILDPDLLSELKYEFENYTVIGQNLLFDLRFLIHLDIWVQEAIDTHLNQKILTMGIKTAKADLGTLCSIYMNIEIDKTLQKTVAYTSKEDPNHIYYAVTDVKYLEIIHKKQLNKLEQHDLIKTYTLEKRFLLALAYMAYCGMRVDLDILRDQLTQQQTRADELVKLLNKSIIDHNIEQFIVKQLGSLFPEEDKVSINWNSSQQVIDYFKFFNISMFVLDKKSKEMKPTVSVTQLEEIDNPYAKLYVEYAHLKKLLSTYGYNIEKMVLTMPDNRLRTNWTQIVDSGRLVSGRGKEKLKGNIKFTNLQNFPQSGRGIFTAKPGHSYIIADYSSQEPRLIAEYSGDKGFADHNTGVKDMHCFFVQRVHPETMPMPHNDIKKKYPDERKECKKITFAMTYLGDHHTIHRNTGLPKELCMKIEKDYYETFSGVKPYFERCYQDLLRNEYILIDPISKRKRYVPEVRMFKALKAQTNAIKREYWQAKKEDSEFYHKHKYAFSKTMQLENQLRKAAANTPIQGTGALMTKLAAVYNMVDIINNKLCNIALCVNMVHDELVYEVPDQYLEFFTNIVHVNMIRAAQVFMKTVPMSVEIKTNTKWIK